MECIICNDTGYLDTNEYCDCAAGEFYENKHEEYLQREYHQEIDNAVEQYYDEIKWLDDELEFYKDLQCAIQNVKMQYDIQNIKMFLELPFSQVLES